MTAKKHVLGLPNEWIKIEVTPDPGFTWRMVVSRLKKVTENKKIEGAK